MLQKPVEIYLDHCKTYAEAYIKTRQTIIEHYKFCRKDLDDHVVTNKLYDLLRLQENDYGG